MYLGIHYTSDLAVGAAIGVATVWLSLKAKWLESSFIRPVLAFADAKPQFFYTAAFLSMYEMTTLFWDVQAPIHAGLHAISHVPHHKMVAAGLVLLAALFVTWLVITLRTDTEAEKAMPQPGFAKVATAGRNLSIH
jgi:membrane-associated phospholipid phosphatase